MSKNSKTSSSLSFGTKTATLALLASVLFSTLDSAHADRIIRKLASPIDNVQVVEEGLSEIKYRRAGNNAVQTIESSKVEAIEYDDAPESYNQGLAFLAAGEYENAVNSFQLSATEKTKGDWVKSYASLQSARAYRLWGGKQATRYTDSVSAYKQFVETYPNSRFYAEGLYELGLAQSGAGDADGAAQTFDKLQDWAFKNRLSVEWEVKALFSKAQSYLDNGNPDEARNAFRRVKSFANNRISRIEDDDALKARVSDIAGQADLKEGEILIQEKKYPAAQRFYENLLKNPSLAPAIKASATNGLGECHFAKKEFKDAQLMFAKSRVAFYSVSHEAARATFFLGRCAEELGSQEPGGSRRAQEYFNEVVNFFAKTSWADQARAKIR